MLQLAAASVVAAHDAADESAIDGGEVVIVNERFKYVAGERRFSNTPRGPTRKCRLIFAGADTRKLRAMDSAIGTTLTAHRVRGHRLLH